MKVFGRVTLFCYKKLPCGVYDRFTVVVSKANESAAVSKYKSIGYEVR